MLTVVGVVAGPQALDRRDELAHALSPPLPGVEAGQQALVFEVVGAAGDADVETTARDDVGHRRLTGQLDRVPERSDDGAGAEAHVCRPPGQIGEVDERIRARW